jgi:hypothetical protein
LSVAPPGLVALSSAYPGLAPWAAFCRRFAAGVFEGLRGAESAALPRWYRLSVCPSTALRAGSEGHTLNPLNLKSKTNVKGNGQERPFHTGKIDTRNDAARIRGSHLSQRTRKMGHPLLTRYRRIQDQGQRQRTGVSVPHGRQEQHQRQPRRCGRLWFPPFDKLRAGFLAKDARNGAPSFVLAEAKPNPPVDAREIPRSA